MNPWKIFSASCWLQLLPTKAVEMLKEVIVAGWPEIR